MRLPPALHRQWRACGLAALLLALAQAACADCALSSAEPLREIANVGSQFVRAAALPAWADLLVPPAPAQAGRAPVVVHLWETQLLVGPLPVRLTQRTLQVNHASALAEIGQLALDFNPRFERLLLHKVLILRGRQTIDHTRTAPVRWLQREAALEQGVYSGVITVSMVLPGVRVGDTLQLVYSIVGEAPALRARFSQRALWDQPYPMAWRRVTLVAPVGRRVLWRWLGGDGGDGPQPTETVVAGVRRLRFEARDLVAVVAEPAMPAHVEAGRRLQFSEYADWNEVARWAQKLFPADAPLPEPMGPLMARLRRLPSAEQRTSQALQWVQGEIRNWSRAVGEYTVRPQLPAVVVARGYGDCKDKALLLRTMLRALAIDARPVLVSQASRGGPALMLPAPDIFDHVIVQVRLHGREYYLDPTHVDQAGLLSRMGQRLEEAAVLPVDAATQGLVIVRSPNRDEIFVNRLHERLSLDEIGATGRLDVEIQWVGAAAELLRLALLRMDAAGFRRFVVAGYLQQYEGSRLLDEPEVSDDRQLNQLTIRARIAVPGLARAVGEYWAVPFAPSLGEALQLPPQAVRRFPLALLSYPATHRYRVDMHWPAGMAIVDEPASLPWETPYFRLRTTRDVRGNSETRTIEFQMKVSEVPADEVPAFAADMALLEAHVGGVMRATGGVPGIERP